LIKVVYVAEGIPGTAEAFKRIHERRPDIVLLATETREDPEEVAAVADMAVNSDFIARGYLIPYGAKKMGAKTLVHVSFSRRAKDESALRFQAIMEKACADLGLKLVQVKAPDPSVAAAAKAKEFISENAPVWLDKYGPDTAFFAAHPDLAAPLINLVAKHGGYFVEADQSSPFMGFPEALGLDASKMGADYDKALKELEILAEKNGASGRLGVYAASLNYASVLAMAEFGRLVASGVADKRDVKALLRCYENATPKVAWKGDLYVDAASKTLNNVFLVYQDFYVFGVGFLGLTDVVVPVRYKQSADLAESAALSQPDFRVALITGEDEQGAEDLIVAREMVARYGDAKDGGLLRHEVYPDNFLNDENAMAGLIEKIADDPLVKVIIVSQAIPGTAEGFRRVRKKRPDIFRLAGEPFEAPGVISASADLAVAADFVARGYLIPYQAKILGAKSLVHVSFPRHLAYETLDVQLRVMKEACLDLGLNFYQEMAPDPVGEAKVKGATDYILANYPLWVEKYGLDTAFYPTNDAHTEPMLKSVAEHGGYFVEADIPSPFLGYPGAFDLDLSPYFGQWPAILEILEKAVVKAGGGGRMGVWVYPLGYAQITGLVEFGKLLGEGKALVSDIDAFVACLGVYSPWIRWSGSFYNDPIAGKPLRNYFLVYEDNYILGRGYIETTKVDVPEKFYSIQPEGKK
jgi:hypothetical protein